MSVPCRHNTSVILHSLNIRLWPKGEFEATIIELYPAPEKKALMPEI